LSEQVLERARARLQASGQPNQPWRAAGEPVAGVFWVPFHDPDHPFHGQVMHLALSPIPLDLSETPADPKHVVGLGWFCRKELRYEDRVEFSEDQVDHVGMPKMTIRYELTPTDQAAIAAARQEQARAAAAFGKTLKENESHMVPPGSSLHYQGTTRMGERDDGESVCDPYSRVWGLQNLFVGGNGVIPTSTACNPTPTSIALAIRACERIAAILA
jgi:pyranose oxidase